MTKYRHHKYTFTVPYEGSVRHQWELIGPRGGVHLFAIISDRHSDPVGGLETHWMLEPPDYMSESAPSQMRCWLLNCPCWHDGTSLYASETLWPIVEPMLRAGDHKSVFRLLEREADRAFRCEESE